MFTKKSNGYMAQVETWLQTEVFPPITRANADGDAQGIENAYARATKLIKDKMLESYRNGLNAKQTSKFKTDV
jgi:hypothetical protein